jgi:ATP-binding cassette subfamily F protein 3
VRDLSKSYDSNKLWDGIALDVKRGERIGIIGPNGSGKTTLLEVLLGKRDADGGDIRWGANLNIGYYDQRLADFDPENTVANEIRGDRDVNDKDIRAVCALMLFRNEDVEKPMKMLSGGERARVALAQLLIDRPNVLILDEPTNHLDVNSCEALEKALRDFIGTILFVSHDRYFLDKVSERLLVIDPPNLIQFTGNYSAWAARVAAEAAEAAAARDSKNKGKSQQKNSQAKPAAAKDSSHQSKAAATAAPEQKPSPSQAAKKKNDNPWARPFGRLTIEELEKQISQTEIALNDCQGRFADPAITRDAPRKKKLQTEYDETARKLKQLEQEYFERTA